MKADIRKQKQQERDAERRSRKIKLGAVAVVALVALGFGMKSFVTGGTPAETSYESSAFRRITVAEFKPQFDRGEVTVIDVREGEAYLKSHIPGALRIPLARVEGEVPNLPKGKPIVTYCSCPAEETSGQAVQILQHAGITNASALQGGIEAWQKRGYPIESGAQRR